MNNYKIRNDCYKNKNNKVFENNKNQGKKIELLLQKENYKKEYKLIFDYKKKFILFIEKRKILGSIHEIITELNSFFYYKKIEKKAQKLIKHYITKTTDNKNITVITDDELVFTGENYKDIVTDFSKFLYLKKNLDVKILGLYKISAKTKNFVFEGSWQNCYRNYIKFLKISKKTKKQNNKFVVIFNDKNFILTNKQITGIPNINKFLGIYEISEKYKYTEITPVVNEYYKLEAFKPYRIRYGKNATQLINKLADKQLNCNFQQKIIKNNFNELCLNFK